MSCEIVIVFEILLVDPLTSLKPPFTRLGAYETRTSQNIATSSPSLAVPVTQ